MAHGMPPLDELPLDRFCNFIWYMLVRNSEEQERTKLKATLWRPPIGTKVTDSRSPWSAENETRALSALKSQLGAK